jgi:hypothetical protein
LLELNERNVDKFANGFSNKWDQIIDWEARWKYDSKIVFDVLNNIIDKDSMILDLATGTGVDLIYGLSNGFNILGIDASPEMLKIAEKKLDDLGFSRDIILGNFEWENLEQQISTKFEAAICLGNSFACVNDALAREKCFLGFSSILQSGGYLIIDHRNYDEILTSDAPLKGAALYYGEGVKISKSINNPTEFIYSVDGTSFNLEMTPIFAEEVIDLGTRSGFRYLFSKQIGAGNGAVFHCLRKT